MSVAFADTSALLALQASADRFHPQARACWDRLERDRVLLVTTSYVLTEIYALLGRRAGRGAALNFRRDLEPLLLTEWVDQALHQEGLHLWLEQQRATSLVDAVSFVLMRRERIEAAWSYDKDFESAGFTLLP